MKTKEEIEVFEENIKNVVSKVGNAIADSYEQLEHLDRKRQSIITMAGSAIAIGLFIKNVSMPEGYKDAIELVIECIKKHVYIVDDPKDYSA